MFDLGMNLVEVGVGSVLPSRDPDRDEPLLGEVVSQDVGRVRETLEVEPPVFDSLVGQFLSCLSTDPKYPHLLSPELLNEFVELLEVALAVGSPQSAVVDDESGVVLLNG